MNKIAFDIKYIYVLSDCFKKKKERYFPINQGLIIVYSNLTHSLTSIIRYITILSNLYFLLRFFLSLFFYFNLFSIAYSSSQLKRFIGTKKSICSNYFSSPMFLLLSLLFQWISLVSLLHKPESPVSSFIVFSPSCPHSTTNLLTQLETLS